MCLGTNQEEGVSMVDRTQIREHMDVIGSDGRHIGTVDGIEGLRIKLSKSDPAAGGRHHYIGFAIVERITADAVCLVHTAEETRRTWQ